MDILKSYHFNFLLLINKYILLFNYIENLNQKKILNNIKSFIDKIKDIFITYELKDKKTKILEILISYFEKLVHEELYNLLDENDRDFIMKEIEKKAYNLCKTSTESYTQNPDLADENETQKEIIREKDNKNELGNENFNNHKTILDLEKKINNKILVIFNEIEKNIKSSIKEYQSYSEFITYDLDQKFDEKLNIYKRSIEGKIKESIKESLKEIKIDNHVYENINSLIKNHIDNIKSIHNPHFENLENIDRKIDYKIDESKFELRNKLNSEIESKIKLLGTIFNENIQSVFKNINENLDTNKNDLMRILDEKINNFNKNNFSMVFDKELNEIKLCYFNETITSCKINIKGLIGPKGPEGRVGQKGDTPIFRKVSFADERRLKFIIQDKESIYEIVSEESMPCGPSGPKGDRGEPGKTNILLKWDQDDVMKVDGENKDSLIFLKSLCVGETSHCLKDNSLAVSGAVCYNSNSFAIGNKSKTLDNESIAFFGTCIGKKAFSYRADNVDENTFQIGQKEKNTYNLNNVSISSKEINFECDSFSVKGSKVNISKFKELEDKINTLEKKMIDILRKI